MIISALTIYIGNVYNFPPKGGGGGGRPTPSTPPPLSYAPELLILALWSL